ncbi:hypothetical protein Nepgr_001308 [Nepenthes gracilis]|uniref:Enhancer of polycomb-like protein n=1 Tax=Nepenthes gracilis TaxID=150966 RepID=A0AAD3P811_NEPGR|nr:hypothetical protein Nepgr_001308 [Nepenthes gracilis]
MPSVGMKRSTRVFVPKTKDSEGVKVLRSGRRLLVESVDGKVKGCKDGDDWLRLIDSSGGRLNPNGRGRFIHNNGVVVGRKEIGRHEASPPKQREEVLEVDGDEKSAGWVNRVPSGLVEGGTCVDKMYGNVYRRKRKCFDGKNVDFSTMKGKIDKMYGQYFMRKRRKIGENSAFVQSCDSGTSIIRRDDDLGVLSAFVESTSCSGNCPFARLISSVLRRMTVEEVGLVKLSAFLLSQPIADVFASCGIHFLWNHQCTKSSGFCKIVGDKQFIPLFTMHFSAIPVIFLHLHASMFFRSLRMSCVLLFHSAYVLRGDQSNTVSDGGLLCINSPSDDSQSSLTVSRKDGSGEMEVDLNFGVAKVACQCLPYRSGMITGVQKRRRRSLRTRRARNPSLIGLRRSSCSLVGPKKIALGLPCVSNKHELRRSVRKSSRDIKVLKSSMIGLTEYIDSVCCSANILVVESDKCYREEGATIMLQTSASNEWILAVTKDGLTRYCHKANTQKEIKPNSSNRFTHAVIWAGESGWKLEFPDRKDWTVFRELYKVCGKRNVVSPSPVVKTIPVPGVHEVSLPNSNASAFVRPESYIKLNDDELSRALLRRTANYDLDSEDEEWLKKFNSELGAGNEPVDCVSEETIELMIDAFEKALFCSPEDYGDVEAAVNLCLDLGKREVVESVHSYWMKKRKQKCAPLVRVFQLNQPRKTQVVAKPVLRKKRSLKRQATHATQCGRGKERSVLEALAAEQIAKEEQSAMLRVQEAKVSAKKSTELAISKRQRAQFLMGNADLAVYRASMALRIAEAARVAGSLQAADHFLL